MGIVQNEAHGQHETEEEAEGCHGHPGFDVGWIELSDPCDHQGFQDQACQGNQDGQEDDIGWKRKRTLVHYEMIQYAISRYSFPLGMNISFNIS